MTTNTRSPSSTARKAHRQLERREVYVVEHLEDMPEVRDWTLGDWAPPG